MFGDTQGRLLTHLRGLTNDPGPNDDYGYSYDDLKAYLLTTAESKRAQAPEIQKFLTPVLLARWGEKRDIEQLRALSAKQFEFYAEELGFDNPYSSDNDGSAIKTARTYLSKFGGLDRLYNNIISQANAKIKT